MEEHSRRHHKETLRQIQNMDLTLKSANVMEDKYKSRLCFGSKGTKGTYEPNAMLQPGTLPGCGAGRREKWNER